MKKLNFECFCGFNTFNSFEYSKHIKSCKLYQDYKEKYLTYDNFYKLYMIDRRLYQDFLSQFPYNKFNQVEVWDLRHKCNFPQLYKTKKGRFLTHQEINDIITYDFLKTHYIDEEMSANEIAKDLLDDEFDHVTVIQRLKEYGLPVRTGKQVYSTQRNIKKRKESRNNPETKRKLKETNIQRFGVPYPIQNKTVKEKAKNSFIKRFGVTSPMKDKSIQDKCKRKWLMRYGVDNPFKSKEVQERFHETCRKRFNSDWPFGNSKIQAKAIESNRAINNGFSKISVELFDEIIKRFPQLEPDINYATHGREVCVHSEYCNFFLDFSYDKNNIKFDIEFNGDYFHANPTQYKFDDEIKIEGKIKKVQDIWQYDKLRSETIENNGYKLLTIWEKDYLTNKNKIVEECCQFINNCLKR